VSFDILPLCDPGNGAIWESASLTDTIEIQSGTSLVFDQQERMELAGLGSALHPKRAAA
jgi:hypothetical protein